jgi:hypothetical protein
LAASQILGKTEDAYQGQTLYLILPSHQRKRKNQNSLIILTYCEETSQ